MFLLLLYEHTYFGVLKIQSLLFYLKYIVLDNWLNNPTPILGASFSRYYFSENICKYWLLLNILHIWICPAHIHVIKNHRFAAQREGAGPLISSSYVGSGPASTLHPSKISGISSTPKKY